MKLHPMTEAWLAFFNAPENSATFDVTTLEPKLEHNYYLANRMERAFREGFNAGEAAGKAEALERLRKLLL